MDSLANIKKYLLPIVLIITLTLTKRAISQNCGCAPDLCCSKYGYCGKGNDYCGQDCREGPCYVPPSSGVNVAGVVTANFFNGIINQAAPTCPGKGFYTRDAFLTALSSYPRFGTTISPDFSKREIAAFFAHVTHETGHMCYKEEQNGSSRNYCQQSQQYPCNPNKKYFGRGPIQLSWNYNYIDAGKDARNKFDGLNNPEIVATDRVISFKSALWFWMENVRPVFDQGFGASIKAINSGECNGGDRNSVEARVKYYKDYCNQIGVSPGNNLSC